MGFLNRIGRNPKPASPASGKTVLVGGREVQVVGESYYQDALTSLCGGKQQDSVCLDTEATLVPEPTNAYDTNAVQVQIGGVPVGHLGRDEAKAYGPLLKHLAASGSTAACRATVVGGWKRSKRDQGHYGVVLDLARPDEALPGWAPPAPVVCAQCGRTLSLGAKFCSECGTACS